MEFSKVVKEIDTLSRNSRIISRIGYVIALESIFHCFPEEYVEKAFHYLFLSREVWQKTRTLFMFEDVAVGEGRHPYREYILGPGHDWFMEKFDSTYSEELGYSQRMWRIFLSCDTHDAPKRVALLYFVVDAISRGEFEDFSLEAENSLRGFFANSSQAIFIH